MKRAAIRIFCLSMLAILTSITSISANDYETLVNDESSEMVTEVADVNYLDSEVLYIADAKNNLTSLLYASCYELKRVWVWSGWRPKRVWKWVGVSCQQAASSRGPGTTIPPH